MERTKVRNSSGAAFWITMIVIVVLLALLNFARPTAAQYQGGNDNASQTELPSAPTRTSGELNSQ